MSDSNEPIASDDGMENPSISTAGKYSVIAIVLGLVVSLASAFYFKHLSDINSPQTVYSKAKNVYELKYSVPVQTGNAEMSNYFGMAYYLMIAIGINCVIWGIWIRGFVSDKIKATEVIIYQDKVKGVAVSRDFSMTKLIFCYMGWAHAKLNSFDLAFNQITSVDNLLDDSSIVINASGAHYKCFVSDGSKIQDVINSKTRKEG